MADNDTLDTDRPDTETDRETAPEPLMSRVERAAVFVSLLSDEDAALLLSRMEPGELEQIGAAMCELGDIEPAHIAEALGDFAQEAGREVMPARGRPERLRHLLERSLGETKAASMMLRIEPEARPRSIEMARWLAPSVVLKLIEDEHPQVIAALLLLLEPEPAAQILTALPEASQSGVLARIAKMNAVSTQAMGMIDALLSQRIGANFGAAALTMGGPRDAANLINLSEGDLRNTALPAIAEVDGPLAERIEEELFTFEMLLDLDPKNMGRLLRDVDNETLIDALKGLPDAQRGPFFAAMSSRAADGIRDEIELRGRLAKSEVQAAQRKVVDMARGLAEQGEITLGSDDGEFI
ncbi:MAG: FliG C-terminal domain-containing protein [Erythrobacter sp.]|uniref:flagellar motor switch protein FliG n=1 Tax=Erythrobacter sp. TaxID=1042 RepID=UPI00262635A4|nr:FliG C-terminal domain-containing protein [Erythrobacter sp.]MDJ0979140.1 FliG C-terminal domain-containing protein [Erythrobacter sp.]